MKLSWIFYFALSAFLLAQTATLRGVVTDGGGAAVSSAKITLAGEKSASRTETSDRQGIYTFTGLAPGAYIIKAAAPQLFLPEVEVNLAAGMNTTDIRLSIAPVVESINVEETSSTVGTDANANASATILRGADLEALSDTPEDLLADLQALAGPSAGPNGGSIYVDGFSGGELPPKESIREIRINQNPFSPEFDKLGLGRIEILTKPGTDKFHGNGFFNFSDDIWNSRNPYAAKKAPFMLKEYGGNVSGPINKRASFFLEVRRDSVDNGSIINAVIVDPQTFGVNPFTDVFLTPQRRIVVAPRIDYQVTPNNSLSARYRYSRADIQD